MSDFIHHLSNQLEHLKKEGLYKHERVITSMQSADITTQPNQHVVNFCANNYLGLANNSELIAAAKQGLSV